jgi:ligand-binding sensor domain-containing protein
LGLLFVAIQESNGQNFPQLRFQQITQNDGLSSNLISGIAEDKNGFIWVGTANGLNRLDGYRIKQYFHDENDSRSISDNRIFGMLCDRKGRLWLSTSVGVSCFLPDSNYFINYTNKEKNKLRKLDAEGIGYFYEDDKSEIFIVHPLCGLYKVKEDLSLQKVSAGPEPFVFIDKTIRYYERVYKDLKGNEWATAGQRIFSIDKQTKKIIRTYDLSDRLPTKNGITPFIALPGNRFLVNSWANGFFEFSPDQDKIIPVAQPFSKDNIVANIIDWQFNHQEWVVAASINYGLVLYNTNFSKYRLYKYEENNPNSLKGITFSNVQKDSKNNLWVCTNSGVNIIKGAGEQFSIIPLTNPGDKDFSPAHNGAPFGFAEIDNSLWINKRYNGTFLLDSNWQTSNFYLSLFPLSRVKYNPTHSAYSFYQIKKEVFITTDSGLVVYDMGNKNSKLYFPSSYSKRAGLRDIVPFSQDAILIRSYAEGLFVFNTNTKKYIRYYKNTDTCATCLPYILSKLHRSGNGKFFLISTERGLMEFDSATGKVITHNAFANKPFFKTKLLLNLAEDKNGLFWVSSIDGIYVYNPNSHQVEKYFSENGKMGQTNKVLIDDNDNVWVTALSGIWCYINKKDKWVQFTKMDGLPGEDFENGLYKDKKGNIWAGVEGGAVKFDPALLEVKEPDVPVIITEATVSGTLLLFPLNNKAEKEIVIPAGKNSITAEFAVVEYFNKLNNHYFYKLSPLMKEYEENTNGHLNFTGLAPGYYTLYVKGADRFGNYFTKEDRLEIIVKPYWYQTNFFKTTLLLVLLAAAIAFFKWRLNSVRHKAGLKQKIAETEMQALRAQMNPHFIFNSLNSIENFIMQNEKRLASDYLNKFARLIRMILDSSRNEVVPVAKDMEALKLYIELEQLRFNNKFRYHSYVDPQLLQGDYKVPSLLIQPYVENAIIHGIAHSDKKDLQLTVTAALENDKIKYSIQDNGVGRRQAAEYNQQNKPRHKSVGLKITEERIAHFNLQKQINGAVKITDLYNDDKQPVGTKVEVLVKTI